MLTYHTIPEHLQGDATALFTMFRNVSGSIGISVSTAAITSRTQIHTAYLAANLSHADPNFRETLSHVSAAIKNLGTVAGDATQAAMGQIEHTLIAQAGLLAYMDVFLYCAILAFAIRAAHLFVLTGEGNPQSWGRMMRAAQLPCAALLLACLSACKLGPNFVRPDEPVPKAYSESAPPANGAVPPDTAWWGQFHDEQLDRLEDRAASSNLGLKVAYLRILEARIQVQAARAQGLPSLNANASYTREQLGLAGIVKSKGQARSSAPPEVQNLISSLEQPINLYQLGFDASWELDLFGKVRRSVEAADAQSRQAVESKNDLLVSLEAEIAQTYFQLRAAQVLQQMTATLIADQREVVELTSSRQLHGLGSDADVQTARAQLASLESQLPQYEQTIASSNHALAVLCGQTPETLDAGTGTAAELPAPPSMVPVGSPRPWRGGGPTSAAPKKLCMPLPRRWAYRLHRCFRSCR